MRRSKMQAIRRAAQDRTAARKLHGLRLEAAMTGPGEGATSECTKCRLPIMKLGGIWTEMENYGINCIADTSAAWTPHEPEEAQQ